jgi:hypothetical protein
MPYLVFFLDDYLYGSNFAAIASLLIKGGPESFSSPILGWNTSLGLFFRPGLLTTLSTFDDIGFSLLDSEMEDSMYFCAPQKKYGDREKIRGDVLCT